jgi:septal ring factor EnvC (AmiA/AmiB activator)
MFEKIRIKKQLAKKENERYNKRNKKLFRQANRINKGNKTLQEFEPKSKEVKEEYGTLNLNFRDSQKDLKKVLTQIRVQEEQENRSELIKYNEVDFSARKN